MALFTVLCCGRLEVHPADARQVRQQRDARHGVAGRPGHEPAQHDGVSVGQCDRRLDLTPDHVRRRAFEARARRLEVGDLDAHAQTQVVARRDRGRDPQQDAGLDDLEVELLGAALEHRLGAIGRLPLGLDEGLLVVVGQQRRPGEHLAVRVCLQRLHHERDGEVVAAEQRERAAGHEHVTDAAVVARRDAQRCPEVGDERAVVEVAERHADVEALVERLAGLDDGRLDQHLRAPDVELTDDLDDLRVLAVAGGDDQRVAGRIGGDAGLDLQAARRGDAACGRRAARAAGLGRLPLLLEHALDRLDDVVGAHVLESVDVDVPARCDLHVEHVDPGLDPIHVLLTAGEQERVGAGLGDDAGLDLVDPRGARLGRGLHLARPQPAGRREQIIYFRKVNI